MTAANQMKPLKGLSKQNEITKSARSLILSSCIERNISDFQQQW